MSIYDVLTPYELRGMEFRQGSAYVEKMMHRIPDAKCIQDRKVFIVERCKGKRVLNLGCASGSLHEEIKKVAASVIGVDRALDSGADLLCDLDFQPHAIFEEYGRRGWPSPELIVAGEIIEHLANPGLVLHAVRRHGCPLIITVPNAFSSPARQWSGKAYENVNPDHVAWYSWRTLKTLVERYDFTVREFHWYHGKPLTAEGLIFVVN